MPVDLETICLKAMEKDPDRRYQTAGKLAEDLRHFVNRFAIKARRAGLVVRLKKWIRRNPGLAAGLACALLATGVATFFAYRAHMVEQQRLAGQARLERQLQQEQRQTALEKAILEAMSGDAPAALFKAIADAERKDAEPGLLNMLRGLVEQYRSRPKEAIVHLEQAEKQLPDSVAVKAPCWPRRYMDDAQYQAQRRDVHARGTAFRAEETPRGPPVSGTQSSRYRPGPGVAVPGRGRRPGFPGSPLSQGSHRGQGPDLTSPR